MPTYIRRTMTPPELADLRIALAFTVLNDNLTNDRHKRIMGDLALELAKPGIVVHILTEKKR